MAITSKKTPSAQKKKGDDVAAKGKRKSSRKLKREEKYAAKRAKKEENEPSKTDRPENEATPNAVVVTEIKTEQETDDETREKNVEFQKYESKKTARKRKLREEAEVQPEVEEVMITETVPPPTNKPYFPPIKREKLMEGTEEMRKVPVPAHRYSPLKENWLKIFSPVVEYLHLQIRFNLKTRNVEIRSSKETTDIGALQKAADFVRAFTLGFDVDDALALVRLDDLFLESFLVTDVKPLKGDHLSRAIGRVAGKGGKTKFTIENVTKTRIVLADSKIHILGSYQNIQIARRAVCNLILGSPPSKVYGNLRAYASRASERF